MQFDPISPVTGGVNRLHAVESSGMNYSHIYSLGHFRIFFSKTPGHEACPAKLSYESDGETPDYVLRIADALRLADRIFQDDYGLQDPLSGGILYASGARFYDILLANLPRQKGLVSGQLADNSNYFPNDESQAGLAIRIQLHNDLIENTATPIHELFHAFQYGYCYFNNLWFMEGLARWSQNITHERAHNHEQLPGTELELEGLLYCAHDAEHFWWRLVGRCGGGRKFIKHLLEECREQSMHCFGDEIPSVSRKKALSNNCFIFQAMIRTVDALAKEADKETLQFRELIHRSCERSQESFDCFELQKMLQVLRAIEPGRVEQVSGYLVSRNFDLDTRTLEVDTLDCTGLASGELDKLDAIHNIQGNLLISSDTINSITGFNRLSRISGTLSIQGSSALESIDGFNSLSSLHSLKIDRNPVLRFVGGFGRLFRGGKQLSGSIKVTNNRTLSSVRFLEGLKATGSSFYLHHNALANLSGLEQLERVGASFSLSGNKITELDVLRRLAHVNGMLGLAANKLETLNGLENLKTVQNIKWNGEYRSLALHGNPKLTNISALSGVRTMGGHTVILVDRAQKFSRGVTKQCPFLSCSIEVVDAHTGAVLGEAMLKGSETSSPGGMEIQ